MTEAEKAENLWSVPRRFRAFQQMPKTMIQLIPVMFFCGMLCFLVGSI